MDPSVRILKFPAIAEQNDEFRVVGEPLFPEFKSLEFLLSRKELLSPESWESLYQQSPFLRSSGMFPSDKWVPVEHMPDRSEITKSVRYWDKASTKDGDGAETAGVLMHRMKNGTFLVEDVKHKRWNMFDREKAIRETAERDGYAVQVVVEQEPGSGGKDSAQATIINLAGFRAAADLPGLRGSKELRAEPYAAQQQAGNVYVLRRNWFDYFIDQHEYFPNGKLKDVVDASSGAFAKIAEDRYNMEVLAS
jgi:predicted phage terminase large subunit-like protein